MTPKQCPRTLAQHAAARFATELLLARCRTGAELAMMPQGRWLGVTSQGLHDWLQAGGFHCEIETSPQTKTAADGRRSLAPIGTDEE